ncbi:hypothetical protein TcWFU_006208 [Taenia crassiceps]|uniref:Uncharacterized protein n=1 Tax=Taenia crassiceps TaxID=6207 RepID=A0ABR4Q9A4_9CEST
MQTRNNYCFEYLVTKAKMPRQRTCCPFMQRTLYRVARNLARLDLGFSCPDLEGSPSPASTAAPTPTLKRKTASHKRRHQLEDIRPSSGGVLNWLVRGTLSRRDPSDNLSSVSPVDRNDVGNDTLTEQSIQGILEGEEETITGEAADHLLLRQKRKLLRRQRIYDMDASLDATTSGNWTEENTNTGDAKSRPTGGDQETVRPLPNQPPARTVHIRRLHARRISSTSQVGQNSMDQTYPPPPQASQTTKIHPIAPLRIAPEIDDWEGEAKGEAGRSHEQVDPTINLPVPTTTTNITTTTAASASIIASVIPPFSVREPVEKQVRSWLESTSDEYDILLKRWSGRTSIAKSKNGGENRSLDLRHQASGESGKRISTCGSEAGHKKQLPRLWKQTTPMSQAIIQNHLEHQHQGFGRSPSKKELTVPSFGFDSGEMSMLQSLEENPEEDFMSLLPPVSSQRRFSDNPLMAKQRGGCAFQPMMSPTIINYSTRDLEPNVKLRSAPTRSFCCIYHKRQGYDKSYRSPNCTCSCSQLRKNPTSSSYTEMVMMYPGEVPLSNCCHSPHNSENLPNEDCCSCSRHRVNAFLVEDMASEVTGSRCYSPLQPQPSITPRSLGSPPFLASPYRNINSQQFTQERLSRQICRDRLTADRDPETPFLDILTKNETFEKEVQRYLDKEIKKEASEEGVSAPQSQTSRLIPPDLVFSPASRRVSAVDIGEEVVGSSVINMLTVSSSPRQLSRQNSIYSMEEGFHHQQQHTNISPQGSLGSERGTFLTPEYQTTTSVIAATNIESKQWVKPARSFDHFSNRSFAVHRAASHSPSHLAAYTQEYTNKPTVHRSDTDCFVRTTQYGIESRPAQIEVNSSRTPEFLSLDSSNSDPQHLEAEFMKEHRYSYNVEGPQPYGGRQHLRSDSGGENKRAPVLLKLKLTSLTTSADCLKQQPAIGGPTVLSAGHHRAPFYVNSHAYHEATKRLAQKKLQQRSGKDLHPRKSLEVESAWSSSQSASLHSSKSPSRNLHPRSKSSEVDIRGGHSSTARCVRRDYTIDERTDEIFQTFLQHDPLMDDLTAQHSLKGGRKSLQQS